MFSHFFSFLLTWYFVPLLPVNPCWFSACLLFNVRQISKWNIGEKGIRPPLLLISKRPHMDLFRYLHPYKYGWQKKKNNSCPLCCIVWWDMEITDVLHLYCPHYILIRLHYDSGLWLKQTKGGYKSCTVYKQHVPLYGILTSWGFLVMHIHFVPPELYLCEVSSAKETEFWTCCMWAASMVCPIHSDALLVICQCYPWKWTLALTFFANHKHVNVKSVLLNLWLNLHMYAHTNVNIDPKKKNKKKGHTKHAELHEM